MSQKKLAILVIILILVFDQILKVWIKTSFVLGEELNVFGNWFILHFVENKGMAFGFEFSGKFGKIILTLFRLIAATVIFWYLM